MLVFVFTAGCNLAPPIAAVEQKLEGKENPYDEKSDFDDEPPPKSCFCHGKYTYIWECKQQPTLLPDQFCGPEQQLLCSNHYFPTANSGSCTAQVPPKHPVATGDACASDADCDKPCHELLGSPTELADCGNEFIDAGCSEVKENDEVKWACK